METVKNKVEKGNYRSVTIKRENEIICILRPPKKALKKNPNAIITELPRDCLDIGWYPIKAIETKKEGEVILYV